MRFMFKITFFGAAALLVAAAGCQSSSTANTSSANTNSVVSVPVNSNTNQPTNSNASDPATNTNGSTINLNVPTSTAPARVAVAITSTGFSPSLTTVAVGTTVVWTNQDNVPHQPASDPHPAHTTLPGFDAVPAVAPGGTYSFTFTKAGRWAYHDHLATFRTGTVIVE